MGRGRLDKLGPLASLDAGGPAVRFGASWDLWSKSRRSICGTYLEEGGGQRHDYRLARDRHPEE